MTTTKITKVKPCDISANLAYRCPKCSSQHWISVKSAQVKGFIIVCDCDCIFKPKLIKNISINYAKKNHKQKSQSESDTDTNVNDIPKETLDQTVSVLSSYGFTKTECIELIKKAYDKDKPTTVATLIKLVLTNIGDNNNEESNN